MNEIFCESAPVGSATSRPLSHIGILLLTAGQSKRMGQNKQLLPWRGKTVLDAVCQALREGWLQSDVYPPMGHYPFMAVTGHDHEQLAPIVESYGFSTVRNHRPEDGQGLSIGLGMQQLVNRELMPLDGVICSVADQPLLDASVVHCLITAFNELNRGYHKHRWSDDKQLWTNHKQNWAENEQKSTDTVCRAELSKTIVIPHYGASYTPGNPVLFGSHWFEALQDIDGDRGGKTIINGPGRDFVQHIWIPADIGDDVDTPEDFQRVSVRESEDL